jgi:hypothetical protein
MTGQDVEDVIDAVWEIVIANRRRAYVASAG